MIDLNSENFSSHIEPLSDEIYIIVFSSPTCGPCNTMKPVFQALGENNPSLKIFDVNTSISPELSSHFGIRGVPTIHFCENREILYSFSGITPLRDLQYVIENINDEFFRENGEFKTAQKRPDYFFYSIITIIVILLFLGIKFL